MTEKELRENGFIELSGPYKRASEGWMLQKALDELKIDPAIQVELLDVSRLSQTVWIKRSQKQIDLEKELILNCQKREVFKSTHYDHHSKVGYRYHPKSGECKELDEACNKSLSRRGLRIKEV